MRRDTGADRLYVSCAQIDFRRSGGAWPGKEQLRRTSSMNSFACRLMLLCLLSAAYFQIAFAQGGPSAATYPEKAIRFIVPFPPGAANDLLARAVGQRLSDRWGQPVIVDNRGGGGGTLGATIAAKAAPDGYTIVIVPATHAINVTLYSKPPYDAVKDFATV